MRPNEEPAHALWNGDTRLGCGVWGQVGDGLLLLAHSSKNGAWQNLLRQHCWHQPIGAWERQAEGTLEAAHRFKARQPG